MYSTLKLAYSVSRFVCSFFLDLFRFFLICVVLLAKLSYFHVDKINVREYRMDNEKNDNPEKLATQGTVHKTKKNKAKHNRCWTPRHASKHK